MTVYEKNEKICISEGERISHFAATCFWGEALMTAGGERRKRCPGGVFDIVKSDLNESIEASSRLMRKQCRLRRPGLRKSGGRDKK